jgi:tetratricopeptide (TPR) repeat protein
MHDTKAAFIRELAANLEPLAVPPVWTVDFVFAVLDEQNRHLVQSLDLEADALSVSVEHVECVLDMLDEEGPPPPALPDAVGRVIDADETVGYEDYLNALIDDSPSGPLGLANRAAALDARGRTMDALLGYGDAIDADSSLCRPYHGRALILQGLGRWPEAKADFEAAAARSSTCDALDLHLDFAELLASLGNFQAASRELVRHLTAIDCLVHLPRLPLEDGTWVADGQAKINLEPCMGFRPRWEAMVKALAEKGLDVQAVEATIQRIREALRY